MGRLSTLPVFFGLAGKRAVIAGGSEPAAWKVELLAAAGAHVEVFAIEASAELEPLAAGSLGGRVTIVREPWTSRAAIPVARQHLTETALSAQGKRRRRMSDYHYMRRLKPGRLPQPHSSAELRYATHPAVQRASQMSNFRTIASAFFLPTLR